MKTKYVKISDLYFEILETSDYYNLEEQYRELIIDIFNMSVSCTLQRQSWMVNDYISLNKAIIIKDEFNKVFKILFKGVINNE